MLRDSLVRRRCVLFIGSGLSHGAGLPTWKELAEHLIKRLVEEKPSQADVLPELQCLLDRQQYADIADYCRIKLGDNAYFQVLEERLRPDLSRITDAHKAIVRVQQQFQLPAIVTTNYDTFIEAAFIQAGVTLDAYDQESVQSLGKLLFTDRPFLLKAHGQLSNTKSLIVTTRDYQRIMHGNPALTALLSAILISYSLLFLGYSLSDVDFRLLMDHQLVSFEGMTPSRFALMHSADISKVEREVLESVYNIRILTCDAYSEIVPFLDLLRA